MPASGVPAFGVAPGRIGAEVAATAGDCFRISFETDDGGRIGVVDGARMVAAGVAIERGVVFATTASADKGLGADAGA